MVMRAILALALITTTLSSYAESPVVTVSTAPEGAARLMLRDGRTITVPKERGQVGISSARIAPDGTVGWLAEFRVEDNNYPVALALIIWRAGKVERRFETVQAFYSWTFYAQGKQVAYHVGPLHGERSAHCELHDVGTGRTLAVWDGDLQSAPHRPVWTDGLRR